MYVFEVAKLFVHNGKLKFHFHMKLVNNAPQDSLNKRAQDFVSIRSLSRTPTIWMETGSVIWLLWQGVGQSEVGCGEREVSGYCTEFLAISSGLWCQPGLSLSDLMPKCTGLICDTTDVWPLISICLSVMYVLNAFILLLLPSPLTFILILKTFPLIRIGLRESHRVDGLYT